MAATPRGFRAPRLLWTLGIVLAAVSGFLCWGAWGESLRPLRIVESSMAPNLLGNHALVCCAACRRDYPIDHFDSAATDQRSVCPLCGTLQTVTRPERWRMGDRVRLTRPDLSSPRVLRWRMVALRQPDNPDAWLVKRIVGLPGETVDLCDGDVLINGRRCAKTLAEFRDLAIPLGDTQTGAAGWQPAAWSAWQTPTATSAWRLGPSGFGCRANAADAWSWLAYQRSAVAGRHATAALCLDDYAYNHAISRRLHPVRDLMVRCHLAALRQGTLAARFVFPADVVQLTWEVASRRIVLSHNERPIAQSRLPFAYAASRALVEFALCDGRALCGINGQSLFHSQLPATVTAADATVQQLELGARGGQFVVERLQVLRDIYYLSPARHDRGFIGGQRLARDQFFVLGDNSPVSEDSRDFGPVPDVNLIGTVQKVRKTAR